MAITDLKIEKANKTALLFGATGMVGQKCLDLLLMDDNYSTVKVFNRKRLEYSDQKILQFSINFDRINEAELNMKGDDVFISIGTTMAKAGSKKEFLKVDYTYIMKIALACLRQGANQLIVVSAAGADKNSYVFYSRVKGELETDLSKLNYWSIHILKPSLILGERKEKRALERIAGKFASGLDSVFGQKLGSYKPVYAYDIALAMTKISRGLTEGVHFYESHEIAKLAIET